MEGNGDPHYHMQNVMLMLDELIRHLRSDIEKIDEPKAQAVFETMAEVLAGLRTTCNHYEENREAGMLR